MTTTITGTNRRGNRITVKVGDRIRFDTNSNIGVREDVVRACFIQHDSLGNSYPAVVLTEHSWTPLAHVLDIDRPKRRTRRIHGVIVSPRPRGWVAAFDGHGCVHFSQPIKAGVWVARKPMALENICAATSLDEAVRKVKARYEAIDRESKARTAARLNAALQLVTPRNIICAEAQGAERMTP
jgi:hypothetical protein